MNRAVRNLAQFPDERLFMVVSEGIPLIVQNAIKLDEAAGCLHQEKQFRASDIFRGFAKEEAAKVLILIDLIRCPNKPNLKTEIANRFYCHVSKRIYATICSYPLIESFSELRELIHIESRRYYLDGPNKADWIFSNSIAAEREQALYVDYVQDITEASGNYFWTDPEQWSIEAPVYMSPDCVELSRALSKVGAGSPDGLSIIADLWREFEPAPETNQEELRELISHTLERLTSFGEENENQSVVEFIVSHWTFPLRGLEDMEPLTQAGNLETLRRERKSMIEWMNKIDAKRHPPPAISPRKVEALSDAYVAWRREVDAQDIDRNRDNDGRLRFRSSSELEKNFELQSYMRVKEMFCELIKEERVALLALAWYGRERGATDWPKFYERANDRVASLGDRYQIGCGNNWLNGLRRWETKPQPFKAGQWYRVES